jgi:glycosyltransferase involved in cell wall biosynthesis
LIENHQLGPYIHFLGKVPDDDLAGLYNAADIFVFPSLYEGFGLPPLEAMACGTPVIAGDAASLPEIVGDAGILVPPEDINGLAGSVEQLLATPSLAEEYTEKGLARAHQFSWDKTAKETLRVYRMIAA